MIILTLVVAMIGSICWSYAMPDPISTLIVALIWGFAVGNFYDRNLGPNRK